MFTSVASVDLSFRQSTYLKNIVVKRSHPTRVVGRQNIGMCYWLRE
jgi:hypothetical protein